MDLINWDIDENVAGASALGGRRCTNCDTTESRRWCRGLCRACHDYSRLHDGSPRPIELKTSADARAQRNGSRVCINCNSEVPAQKQFARGLCGACYKSQRRHGEARKV
jgi:cytochrome c peroxidase